MDEKDYIYFDTTVSLCQTCLRKVDTKIIFSDNKVYYHKHCIEHGSSKVLIATDVEFYLKQRQYNKPSQYPLQFNTKTKRGCPWDCGICPDHEQHACISLIEVTDRCNLKCPTCYAGSGPKVGNHRSLETINQLMDLAVANEGSPDVMQISGGEPTIHPDFFAILDLAKSKPIGHLLINTNGIKIANDLQFVAQLADYKPGIEVYLQFDSLRSETIKHLRGADLVSSHMKALENLNEFNISTTLVVVLEKHLNLDQIGEILDFAKSQRCVRGVTFQPTQVAGRLDHFNPEEDRLTMTEVRKEIIEQWDFMGAEDLVPVPCHPEGVIMGYGLKVDQELEPLSKLISPDKLFQDARNMINFEKDLKIKEQLLKLFSTSNSLISTERHLSKLLCCLPKVYSDKFSLSYENIFRVMIVQFFDPWNFDIRSIKKSCVHIATEDGRMIPFDTMNFLYRDQILSRFSKN